MGRARLSANLPCECFPESEAGSRGWRRARLSGKQEPGGSQKPACRGRTAGWGGGQLSSASAWAFRFFGNSWHDRSAWGMGLRSLGK